MKFATIAVLAVATTSVDAAASCGAITGQAYSDAKCTKKAGAAKKHDMTAQKGMMDKCKAVGKQSMKVYCDTAGMHINVYKDAKCTAAKKDATKSKTWAWGKCKAIGKNGMILKGAETLKMAVTGAALALVASQF